MLATPISPGARSRSTSLTQATYVISTAFASWLRFLARLAGFLICLNAFSQADPRPVRDGQYAQKAKNAFEDARTRYHADTNDLKAAAVFARACFDWADYVTNSPKRAQIAEQGIAVSRHLLTLNSNSVPGHYFLAMNLGQLARTKSLGALKIVTQMESEFNVVVGLDAAYDFAGADRNLGLLYWNAPGWPISLGNRTKARQHLQRAVKLSHDYPENQLNLIEAELEWGERKDAIASLKTLNDLWPDARAKLTGDNWTASWADWDKRRTAADKKARLVPKPVSSAGK